MKHKCMTAVAVMATVTASPGFAWHGQGHMMTAEIAWAKMTPGARCRAAMLLRHDPEYSRGLSNPSHVATDNALFVNAATWPDRIKFQGTGFVSDGNEASEAGADAGLNIGLKESPKRLHKYWHFIDFPIPDSTAHTPPAVNAAERVSLFVATLSNSDTSDDGMALKAYDLAWTLHLVGDLHQPLHASKQFGLAFTHGNDSGGNGVKLSSPKPYKELHGFWDGTPGDDSKDDTVLATAIDAANLPLPSAADAAILDPMAWAQESHALTLSAVLVKPVVQGKAGPFRLRKTYIQNAKRVGLNRVALGGARLGNILNAALTWPVAGCS